MKTDSGYRHEVCEYDLSGPTAKIYALFDVRPGKEYSARYVGMTTKTLDKRLGGHIRESRRKKRQNYRTNWIAGCVKDGCPPMISLLEEVPFSMWQDAERAWISTCRGMGCSLVNMTEGGEGIINPSEEIRKKKSISATGKRYPLGRKVSEDTKEKIRKARLQQEADKEKKALMVAGIRRFNASEDGKKQQRGLVEKARTSEGRRKNSLAKKAQSQTVEGKELIRHLVEIAHTPEAIRKANETKRINAQKKKELNGQLSLGLCPSK